ncbi:MAG: DUF4149 domain-containing protein [Gemmatimonadetes bacterium]|jgi:hypothetical protein|nr:DUF4149 domain-containing protein [Gemmatimonadota bacterium]
MSARTPFDGRLAVIALLAAWLGATIIVGAVVAPAAFAVLPTRTLAGALVGRVLPPLFWSGAVVGLFAAVMARRSQRTATFVAALLITASSLVAQLVVGPRIEVVRASAGGPVDALARDDARRIAFGRLHGASVALLGLAGLAAGVTLLLTARAAPAASPLTLRTSHDHG